MPGERRSRRSRRSQAVLPVYSRKRLSNAVSCWYCDLKISAFNGFLFTLGSKHARYLRVWFTIGIGASFLALAVMTVFLLQQLLCTSQLHYGSGHFCNLPFGWLIPAPAWASNLRSLSLMDAGVMVFSTMISVLVHEFGHAISAARSAFFFIAVKQLPYVYSIREMILIAGNLGDTATNGSHGVQIEYLALFLSVIFPGALVAFNYSVLQALPPFSALRIYCAGIWHNFVLSAACCLALLSLPGVLYPFYVHGERPTVLSVPPVSPLSGYLSPGDIIMSLNGQDIHNPEEWTEKVSVLDPKVHNLSNYSLYPDDSMSMKGYCIPNSWIKDQGIPLKDDETVCPDDLVAFKIMRFDGNHFGDGYNIPMGKDYCFPPQDIVKLKKCGGACRKDESNQTCTCLEDECCLLPIQSSHAIWVEVSVSRPYLLECLKFRRNETSTASKGFDSGSTPCFETLVFVGDISVANSIKLTAYQPRWSFGSFSIHLPTLLEKMLLSMLRISASLGLLNCMPVFHLDGESMLEVSLSCITCIDHQIRRRILRLLLAGGTSLFAITIVRVFFSIYWGYI